MEWWLTRFPLLPNSTGMEMPEGPAIQPVSRVISVYILCEPGVGCIFLRDAGTS